MAKKDENLEAQQAAEVAPAQEAQAPAAETPNRDKWFANLRGKYGEDLSEEDLYGKAMESYDAEHEYAKQARNDVNEFANVVNQNPALLNFYQRVIELGADDAEMALAELGDDLVSLLTGEIDSEAYKEIKRRKAETEAENARKAEENEQKRIAQRAALEAFCQEKGIDPDEFIDKVQKTLLEPISAFSVEKELFETLYKMLNYDEDIEAAEVRGRNAKITAERKKAAASTDGLVNRGSASAGTTPKNTKRSIFDVARDAE